MEDVVRHYGVICDWDTGKVLPRTAEQFRDAMRMRTYQEPVGTANAAPKELSCRIALLTGELRRRVQ